MITLLRENCYNSSILRLSLLRRAHWACFFVCVHGIFPIEFPVAVATGKRAKDNIESRLMHVKKQAFEVKVL